MRVRQLRREDLNVLLELYDHLTRDRVPPPSRTHLEAVWDELCTDPRYLYFGAEIDGRIVASCTVTIIPNLTRSAKPYGVIENVVTHSDFRRRGCGAAVMNEAIDRCWAADCYKVMLLSGAGREEAHAFYENLGFDKNAKQGFVIRPE